MDREYPSQYLVPAFESPAMLFRTIRSTVTDINSQLLYSSLQMFRKGYLNLNESQQNSNSLQNLLVSAAMDGEDIFNYLVLDFFIKQINNKIRIKIFH